MSYDTLSRQYDNITLYYEQDIKSNLASTFEESFIYSNDKAVLSKFKTVSGSFLETKEKINTIQGLFDSELYENTFASLNVLKKIIEGYMTYMADINQQIETATKLAYDEYKREFDTNANDFVATSNEVHKSFDVYLSYKKQKYNLEREKSNAIDDIERNRLERLINDKEHLMKKKLNDIQSHLATLNTLNTNMSNLLKDALQKNS